jgi:hypothetical protein
MNSKLRAELEAFADQAEKALRDAVKGVIEEHRRSGKPLAMMRGGKAALVPPDQVSLPLPVVAEARAVYRTGSRATKQRKK